MIKVDSVELFKPQWFCWKLLGVAGFLISDKLKSYYYLYGITLNILITFLNPLHFLPVLFANATQSDDIKNLSIALVCIACSIKLIIYTLNFNKIRHFEKLLRHLDARIKTNEELAYWSETSLKFNIITYGYTVCYGGTLLGIVVLTAYMLILQRYDLNYMSWYPFDWRSSLPKLYAAQLYNVFAIMVQIVQNFALDSFPVTALCLLSTHVQLLCIRLSKLGKCNKPQKQKQRQQQQQQQQANEEELLQCILDQKVIYDILATVQHIISIPLFVQFSLCACNVCLALAAIIFYATNLVERIYFCVYFCAVLLQAFPVCYFGSELEVTFGRLSTAIYLSNWPEQSPTYKRNMLLFGERCLKNTKVVAGYVIVINLDTFVSVLKGAYSLLALIINIKT